MQTNNNLIIANFKIMKISKNISIGAFAVLLSGACNEGIDPISRVDPGPDQTAPVVTITYPLQGTRVQVTQDVAPINIQFEASDVIEVESIVVSLDGTQIATFNDFKDYRRAIQTYTHETLANGTHTLTVMATDVSGKSTSTSVEFEKVPPYQPVFEGEDF